MPEVYVHAVEGRTLDQKRSLVKDITDAVVRHFKVPPEAVMRHQECRRDRCTAVIVQEVRGSRHADKVAPAPTLWPAQIRSAINNHVLAFARTAR